MYESEETLWKSERFAILRETEGTSAGKLKVVNLETGVVDWPLQYPDGHVAFDFPTRIPPYVQDAVLVAYQPEGEIRDVRLQLCLMDAFMEETPPPEPWLDGTWWGGSMPAYPAEYIPDEWGRANWPIWKVWDEFLGELKAHGMTGRYEQAQELGVADLIAASEAQTDWGDQ